MIGGIILALGRKGTGKSYILRQAANAAARKGSLVLVSDSIDDWAQWEHELEPGIYLEPELSPDDMAKWALANAPCTLVFDELDLAFPLHKPVTGAMANISRRGRHYGVTVLGTTQRPGLVSTEFRALINAACIFQLTAKRDIQWVRENIDDQIDPDIIRSLKLGEFIFWR